MKSLTPLLLIMLTVLVCPSLHAQGKSQADSTGLAGDHFSLEAALDLFKASTSPEDFEMKLNSADNPVNNLDLNEDGEVDYIRVIDNKDGDVHAIVLQVPVSEDQSQDIAVIEIEKDGPESAILQIIGDATLYGQERIVEPYDESASDDQDRGGPSVRATYARVVVNVWFWPSVRFVYAPGYSVWVSPWRWRVYPTWYRPWRPLRWSAWHVRVAPYRVKHYHVVRTHRVVRAHKVYTPRSKQSSIVRSRTTTTVKTRKGTIQKTTRKTTVKGPRGNKAVKKQTKVSGKRRGG